MTLEVVINGSIDPSAHYFTFAPSPCRIRWTSSAPSHVTLSSRPAVTDGGRLVFFTDPAMPSVETLELDQIQVNEWQEFWVGGHVDHPSKQDKDCLLVIDDEVDESTVEVMVRVRKNANNLTNDERDRFLDALQAVNNGGQGAYQDLRSMHVNQATLEEHGGPQFLPWHRSFLLDLERLMQAEDPSVALHYWRFDEPAPNVFTPDFMGQTQVVTEGDPGQPVVFTAGHPFGGWITDLDLGIIRSAYFDTQSQAAQGLPNLPPAQGGPFLLIDEAGTLALGDAYRDFRSMEGTPHGAAHVSFGGSIGSIPTAVKDPLFFMLHSNVDRLWALWQWMENRFDTPNTDTYIEGTRDGRRLADTLWPWNNVTGTLTPGNPRPPFAPRGGTGLQPSPVVAAPGAQPVLSSMIDAFGHIQPDANLGFGYDDVPFENAGGQLP